MDTNIAMPYRLTLAGLLSLIGLNAIYAGYGFIGTPDGSAVGIPREWLEGTPFHDYLIPGIVLLGLGVLHVVAAVLQFRRLERAPWFALVAGCGLSIWIIVQAGMMGSTRHPVQTTLQIVCMVIGILSTLLAMSQLRA